MTKTISIDDFIKYLKYSLKSKYDFFWWCPECKRFHPGRKGEKMVCPNAEMSKVGDMDVGYDSGNPGKSDDSDDSVHGYIG